MIWLLRVIKKLNTLLLVITLLAWSTITPVQAGQGKQGFNAASGKVVFLNLTTASAASDTAVKKLTDTAFKATTYFCTTGFPFSSVHPASPMRGFVYRHPVYNTLSAQAP